MSLAVLEQQICKNILFKKKKKTLTARGEYQNRYLCCRPSRYCVKLLSTEDYGFRPSSTDVDRGTTVLNALKVRYFSIYFIIFEVQTVSEIVCYCLSGLDVWLQPGSTLSGIKRENM